MTPAAVRAFFMGAHPLVLATSQKKHVFVLKRLAVLPGPHS